MSNISTVSDKPRMLLFRQSLELLATNSLEPLIFRFERMLHHYFDVVLIDYDCDYSEVVEKHQPDISLFHGRFEMQPNRLKITNANTHRHIPRAGYMPIDALSPSKWVFFEEMYQYGVEYFFSPDTAIKAMAPFQEDQIAIIPFFINSDLFKDYGIFKSIPCLMTGSFESAAVQYEWRIKIKPHIMRHFPYLYFKHPGFAKQTTAKFVLAGEEYAKTINASLFSFTCGSFIKAVVMKHLEIPGARSCLVTEKTQALEEFGFRDMQNCVFADETNIVDKVDYLLKNREELAQVTSNGYELVHSRHTVRQRPHILQWLHLRKNLKAGQHIIQQGLFDDLKVVNQGEHYQKHRFTEGLQLELMKKTDESLATGEFINAADYCQQMLKYVDYMAEPLVRLGISALLQGKPEEALKSLNSPVNFELSFRNGDFPEPVEWSYFLLALLCKGDRERVLACCSYFPELKNTELTRIRWIIYSLYDQHEQANACREWLAARKGELRPVHTLLDMPLQTLINHIQQLLAASKQEGMINKLRSISFEEPARIRSEQLYEVNFRNISESDKKAVCELITMLNTPPAPPAPPLTSRIKRKVKNMVKRILRKA